ncbi:MAG TPA: BrnT family toxin [Candidatus Wunengus sp. YC60]|uniref:BrnT family toxin n=1 Tax=Candidatus Wunengus sp. YC60 TaxID=3367697 RepID=UPI0040291207
MRYYFDWDPNKAKANRKKHGISFELASTIFLDPRMIAIFDTKHSEHEDRWATIGIDMNGILLVVVHTFQQLDADCCKIRIISARKATRKESRQYQEESK